LEDITPRIEVMFFQEGCLEGASDILEIPKIYYTRSGYYEDVSDLNGIALPALYFDYIMKDKTEGQDSIKSMIQGSLLEMRDHEHEYLRNMVNTIPEVCKTASDYLYMSNIYVAIQEKLYFKLKQIDRIEYNWISDEIIDKCKDRFDDYLGYEFQDDVQSDPEIEKQIIHYNHDHLQLPMEEALFPYFGNDMKFRFCARVDLLTKDCLYELKCTSAITIEHKLQVVLYAWLWRLMYPDNRRVVKIYNVRTNEKWVLNASHEDLEYVVVSLLKNKYCETEILEIDDFVEKCQTILDETILDEMTLDNTDIPDKKDSVDDFDDFLECCMEGNR